MSTLNSSVTLSTTLPSTTGYTLDTTVASGTTAEFSQDQKFKLQATSATGYDSGSHQYVTTYGLALANVTTSSSITLASGASSNYAYVSLSNFAVADDTFYVASYLKGANQVAFRVFDDTGATVIAETIVDSGTKVDSIYYDGSGALVLAYNNSTEFASLAFSDPDAPVANADTATMKQDAVLTVNVLANDTDPTSDTLSLISAEVVGGSADVAIVKGKLTVDYTGDALWLDETAQITVNYVVSDGSHSSTGTLTVDVTDPFNRITNGGQGDILLGAAGRDYVRAGGGDDIVQGSVGSDVILGEGGSDQIYGDAGDDILIGGTGDDSTLGGAGNDILLGGEGNDVVYGGGGDDTLIDSVGNDKARGFEGDDTIYDGAGKDTYTGGDGADTFYFFLGAGSNRIDDFDSSDTVRVDTEAAAGMAINRQGSSVSLELADGGQIKVMFESAKAAKATDWYEIGDYSVPTDSHGLY